LYAIAGGVAVGHVTFFASPEASGADASIVNKWSNVAAEDSLDAEVVEEDTALVLSAPVKASLKDSMHPVRLYTALHEFEEFAAGTLLMTAGSPVRVRAVVYNLRQMCPFANAMYWLCWMKSGQRRRLPVGIVSLCPCLVRMHDVLRSTSLL